MMPTRVAIVTGAARGIGRAIALQLADDGLDVAVADLSSTSSELASLVSEIEAKGRKSLSVPTDVTIEQQVKDLVRTTVDELGGLDVMVANAGVCKLDSLLDLNMDDFDRTFAVNVKGLLFCYVQAAKAMIAQKRGGKIIGASSLAGKKGVLLSGAYSASKFAVRSLTQTAALEFGSHDITVNAYAPGAIETPLVYEAAAHVARLAKTNETATTVGQSLVGTRPVLAPMGKPEDVAKLVSFLASSDSSYITGQTVSIDGGMWFD